MCSLCLIYEQRGHVLAFIRCFRVGGEGLFGVFSGILYVLRLASANRVLPRSFGLWPS